MIKNPNPTSTRRNGRVGGETKKKKASAKKKRRAAALRKMQKAEEKNKAAEAMARRMRRQVLRADTAGRPRPALRCGPPLAMLNALSHERRLWFFDQIEGGATAEMEDAAARRRMVERERKLALQAARKRVRAQLREHEQMQAKHRPHVQLSPRGLVTRPRPKPGPAPNQRPRPSRAGPPSRSGRRAPVDFTVAPRPIGGAIPRRPGNLGFDEARAPPLVLQRQRLRGSGRRAKPSGRAQ